MIDLDKIMSSGTTAWALMIILAILAVLLARKERAFG